LAIHEDLAPLVKTIFGDSALRRGKAGRALMKGQAAAKSAVLAADTYHGVRGLTMGAAFGGRGARLGYSKGLTLFEFSDQMLDKAIKDGDISKQDAAWVRGKIKLPDGTEMSNRDVVMAPIRQGMNVSRYADNLL